MAFFPSGPFSPLVLLATVILVSYQIIGIIGSNDYDASVFEFKPVSPPPGRNLSRAQAVELMMKNIDTYKLQARRDRDNKKDIIVFPEYGLFGIFGYAKYARRTDIYPFLETIPDPKKVVWNPCDERRTDYLPSTEIQKELSCMAKVNRVYVVANVGEKLACKKHYDSSCPNDGRYQYNTNVVYSSNGTLVAKYRKMHLFKENYYNSPLKTEIVTFNTNFGTFGLMTSYDSLFKSPIVDLVKKLNVRNIVMPNAWLTSLPLFRAIQWNSALARGLEINLLVSTIHDGHCKSYGSGIYGKDGAKEYFSTLKTHPGKLISKFVKSPSRFQPRQNSPVIPRWPIKHRTTYNYSMAIFNQDVTFKFVEFFNQRDDITVCHSRFCCRLKYTADQRIETYALGVYKGNVRTLGYLLAVEVCAVVRCNPTCGQPIEHANSYFDTFDLEGVNFSTPYVYPQVLTIDEDNIVHLPRYQWEYKQGQIIFTRDHNYALHSASLIGRVYDKDAKDYRSRNSAEENGRHLHGNHAHVGQCTSAFILIVAFIASIIFSS